MFDDEAVVGKILIEGANDVVAIAPGFILIEIEFMSVGFRESDEVQPVPGPTLAVVRRCEQPVHHLLERAGEVSLRKASNLIGSGRKSGEIEARASQ